MSWHQYVKAALGLSFVAVVLMATGAGPAIAQGMKPLQAFVVNTSAQPVPVNVVSETPLPVTADTRDLDLPARTFVNFEFSSANPTYVVPDGKVLVIDWVSSTGAIPGAAHVLEFQGQSTHGTDTTRWVSYFSFNEFGTLRQQVQLYAKAGQTISWRTLGQVSGQLFAQGHLVSAAAE